MLKEVKDVLDEVGMIQAVLLDQETVLNTMSESRFANLKQFKDVGPRVLSLMQVMKRSFQNMKDRAEAVEKGVSQIELNTSLSGGEID